MSMSRIRLHRDPSGVLWCITGNADGVQWHTADNSDPATYAISGGTIAMAIYYIEHYDFSWAAI